MTFTRLVPAARSSLFFTFFRLFWFTFSLSHLAGAEAAKAHFDLPSDVLEKSLKRFSAQSGLEVLVQSDAFAEIRTRPVRGRMSSREALDAMLVGTGLKVLQDPKTGAFAVHREAPLPNGAGAAQKT